MTLIPVWQESNSGIPDTNLGNLGAFYDADFWRSQGIFSTTERPVIVEFRGDQYIIGAYSRPIFRLASDKQWYPAGIVGPFFPVQVALSPAATGISGAALAYITFLQKIGDRVVQESNPSNVVDLGNMADHARVWSNIQNTGAEFHVTHVRGYVSMDGADYRMAWEAPYGITTITESVSTTRLSHAGPGFDHNIPPSGVLYGHAWAGRMIYANNAQYPYRLWISKAGAPGYVPTDQFRDTYGREPITGIWKGRNELVVFCARRAYMLRQFGTGDNDFVLEQLDSDVGCLTHHGIMEIHNRLWFPSEDGVWLYDGSFRYLMSDLRELWQFDYANNRDSFRAGFAAQDRINKCYMFFTTRPARPEWENTDLNPGTIRYVGYYANFEPSMAGQYPEPDWSLDFVTRFDSAALYSADGELLIASCDGIVRRQDSTNGDDDGDAIGKHLIIRHGHNSFFEFGDDIQSGKHLEQVWCHVEAELNSWQLRCLGGDEDAWRQVPPDNSTYWWKYDSAASALTQAITHGGSTTIYTYCAKSVHFFTPEKVVGRGFTFEIRGTTPVNMQYRGVGGMWSPGPAKRPPIEGEACTYPALVLEDATDVDLSQVEIDGYDGNPDTLANLNTTYQRIGQSFQPTDATPIAYAAFDCWKLGSPTGNARAYIYADSGPFGAGGVPTGAPLATSSDLPVSSFPASGPNVDPSLWPVFTFPTPLVPTPGADYFFVVEYTSATLVNSLRMALSSALGHAGNFAQNDGAWAAVPGGDLRFRLLAAGVSVDLSASDLDDGSAGVAYWRIELLDSGGAVVQSDEDTNPSAAIITFDCSHLGVNTVRITAWDTDITLTPEWEPCAVTGTVLVTVEDPLGLCP